MTARPHIILKTLKRESNNQPALLGGLSYKLRNSLKSRTASLKSLLKSQIPAYTTAFKPLIRGNRSLAIY